MMPPSPFWGFEFIRGAAESGRRGRAVATAVTFAAGVAAVVLGLAFGYWVLAAIGAVGVVIAVVWIVLACRAFRDADRLQRRSARRTDRLG